MSVVTLATGKSIQDLKILLYTLETWYGTSSPSVYLYTDDASVPSLPSYKGKLHIQTALNSYTGLNRQQMEKIGGTTYKTKWTDFMCEKINAMRWAFREADPGPEGLWFLDADICLFNKLPTVPVDSDLALAPHYIRSGDEAKYGRYNGGFLWMRDPHFLDIWTEATHTSRFFEQAALESVAAAARGLYEFPIQNNFGWWRMFQSLATPEAMVRNFGFHRGGEGIGLTFQGLPLGSVHTHFLEKNDPYTMEFNQFLLALLEKLGKYPPAHEFLRFLRKLRVE
jgi:hypothetical protein